MTYRGDRFRDHICAVRAHFFFASVFCARLFFCHIPVAVIMTYCREHFDLALIDLIADLTVERFKPVLRTSRFYIYDGFRAPYMFSVIVRE